MIELPAALADLFVRSGLLLILAWAAASAIGKAGAPAASRHLIWSLALAALLLLPLLAAFVPAFPLPILPAEPPTASPAAAAPSLAPAPIPAPAGTEAALLWTLYALVAVAVAARLLIGHVLLAAKWRRAEGNAELDALLDGLVSTLGIARPVRLRLSSDSAMPITWGLLSPRILLPADAADWPDEKRRLVLLHELAHVSRFDSPVRLAAGLASALYWFQPLIWFAARELRIEQEHAADDLVLEAGAGPRVYAFSLLEFAGGRPPRTFGGFHAAMGGPSELERRLAAIVAPARRGGPGRFFASAAIAVTSASAVFAAAATPVAPTPPVLPVPLVEPVAPTTPSLAAPAAAPKPSVQDVSPARHTDRVTPAEAVTPIAPIAAIAAAEAVPAVPAEREIPARHRAFETGFTEEERLQAVEAYRRARSVYRQQRREYHEQVRDYNGQVRQHHRQLAVLSREGNLADGGNPGNPGNVGNEGNEGGPGHMPVFPIAPIPPTPPTPPVAAVRSVAAIDRTSQGP